jgi:integrase
MGLYKQKSSDYWHMSYSIRGRQYRRSTGTTNKKIAEEIYCKRKAEILEGTYIDNPQGKSKTLSDLVERYWEDITPTKRDGSQKEDFRYGRYWNERFGNRYLNEIDSDSISRYIQKRKKLVGPSTINRELAFLSAAFNKGIKLWKWCKENPVSMIPREKENQRVKYFSSEEFHEILNHLVDWVKPIVLLGKNTGLRVSNLVNLKWNQVDLKNQLIIIDGKEMKNSENLGIPLNDNALQVLKDQFKQRGTHHSFVFCKEDGTPYSKWGPSQAFKRACKQAGYPDYRFHDLRHDFCSKLVQEGVDLYVVKELVGHKDISTTQRYSHLNPDRLKKAVSSLDYHNSIIEQQKGLTG